MALHEFEEGGGGVYAEGVDHWLLISADTPALIQHLGRKLSFFVNEMYKYCKCSTCHLNVQHIFFSFR